MLGAAGGAESGPVPVGQRVRQPGHGILLSEFDDQNDNKRVPVDRSQRAFSGIRNLETAGADSNVGEECKEKTWPCIEIFRLTRISTKLR